MTTADDHALLMSRFLEEELTDAEERDLFRVLSESADARTTFAALRTVKSALSVPLPPDTPPVPAATDERFAILTPGPIPVPGAVRAPVSSPSVLLSLIGSALVIVMFLLSSGGPDDTRTVRLQDGPERMYQPSGPMLPR